MVGPAGKITLQQYARELKYQRAQLYQLTYLLRKQIQDTDVKSYAYLLSAPGIGGITAMGLIAEIGDFSRFGGPDEYCSMLGLCPWEDSSGESIKTKGMQPRCNRHLRPLLIEASWAAIRKSPLLFAYYSKHAARNNKAAIVKVARRLALIARSLVIKQQPYQPDYLKEKKEEQKMVKAASKRFSSGITEQQENKQPGHVFTSWPG